MKFKNSGQEVFERPPPPAGRPGRPFQIKRTKGFLKSKQSICFCVSVQSSVCSLSAVKHTHLSWDRSCAVSTESVFSAFRHVIYCALCFDNSKAWKQFCRLRRVLVQSRHLCIMSSNQPKGKGAAPSSSGAAHQETNRLYDRMAGRGKLVLKKNGIDKKKKAIKSDNVAPNELKLSSETNLQLLDKREKLKSDKFCK
jgi:hypothetical protein